MRVGVTALVLLCGLVALWRLTRHDKRYLYVAAVPVLGFMFFIASTHATGGTKEARYMCPYVGCYLLFMGGGLVSVADWLADWWRLRMRGRNAVIAVVVMLGGLPLVVPDWYATRLTGKPTPYGDIQKWFDTHLRKGTLVLVDRWFEPWNELRVYNSTNAIFTFTIPNEPLDVYVKQDWRGTAERFLETYPDAAFLEVSKSYYDSPGVGVWDWPRKRFSRHEVIVNEAGLKLRELGLANRGDFYAPMTNRLVVDVYFNTPQDVLDRAKAAGKSALVLYADGWEYTKLWRQIPGDFRDWRVLKKEGALDVYNLANTPANRTLIVRGVALNGGMRVRTSNAAEYRFPQGQIVEWRIAGLELVPGLNRVTLSDAGRGTGPAVLLLESVRIE